MSKIREDIQKIEFTEAILIVRSTTINFNFTRVAINIKTNIRTKEVKYVVVIGGNNVKEFEELDDAIEYFEKSLKGNKNE